MGLNLVDLITSQLGGGTVSKLAGALGLEPDQAQAGLRAGVPAILAGLTAASSTPDGAQRIADAAARQDTGILDNFANVLGGQATALSQGGASTLNSLLGGGMLSSLTSALSKFTGIGQSGLGSLLGMIAPLIMGVLGRQQSSLGLDASGLANLLSSQKQNIANAMPAGLGSMLGSIPGLGAITDTLRGAGDTARSVSESARNTVGQAGHAARDTAYQARHAGTSAARWVLPLAAAVLIGLILWQMIPRGKTTPVAPLSGAVAATSAEATRFTTGVKDAVAQITTTLGEVKDPATAEAAVPRLREVSTALGTLRSTWDSLPASARSAVSATVNSATSTLQPLFDKVTAIPGVSEKIKPVLDDIMSRLTAMR